MTMAGPGQKQPKPSREGRREPTVVDPRIGEADRDKAMEALRQQKINPSKRDLVSDFYENPSPPKKK
jgi:hypothetical protein